MVKGFGFPILKENAIIVFIIGLSAFLIGIYLFYLVFNAYNLTGTIPIVSTGIALGFTLFGAYLLLRSQKFKNKS